MNSKKKRLEMEGVLSSFISSPQPENEPIAENSPVEEIHVSPNIEEVATTPVAPPTKILAPVPVLVQLSVKTNPEALEQLRNLAFWQRRPLQDLIQEVFDAYLKTIPSQHLAQAKEERMKFKK